MRKFITYILGLVIVGLGLGSFCNAGSITYNIQNTMTINKSTASSNATSAIGNIPVPKKIFQENIGTTYEINCNINNINTGGINVFDIKILTWYNNGAHDCSQTTISPNGTYSCIFTKNQEDQNIYSIYLQGVYSRPVANTGTWSIDMSCTISGTNIIDGNSGESCNTTGNLSDYIPGNILYSGSVSLNNSSYTNVFNYGINGAGTYCMKFTSTSPQTFTMGFANGSTTAPSNLYTLYNDQYGNRICLYGNKPYLNVKLNSSSTTANYEVYKLTDLLDTQYQCPNVGGSSCDTGAILSGYILQSVCDSQYSDYVSSGVYNQCLSDYNSLSGQYNTCTNTLSNCSSNLNSCNTSLSSCLSANCPTNSGDISWSALYINDLQHLGSDSIYITIPEEIDWDYSRSDSEFNLVVNGINGDQDYINAIIDQQTIHPSSEDFGKSIALLFSGYAPYAIILVFLLIVWGLIRKIFK